MWNLLKTSRRSWYSAGTAEKSEALPKNVQVWAAPPWGNAHCRTGSNPRLNPVDQGVVPLGPWQSQNHGCMRRFSEQELHGLTVIYWHSQVDRNCTVTDPANRAPVQCSGVQRNGEELCGDTQLRHQEFKSTKINLDLSLQNKIAWRGVWVIGDGRLPVWPTSVLIPTDEPGIFIGQVDM